MEVSWRSVSGNILSLIFGSFTSQLTTFLTMILILRQTGPEQYGQYTSSITLITFAAILYNLGLDVWLLKEGGALPHRLGEIVGSLFAIRIVFGFGLLLIWFLATTFFPISILEARLFRINTVIVWLNSLLAILLTSFKADLRSRVSALLELTVNIAIFLGTLLLAFIGVTQILPYLSIRIGLLLAGVVAAAWFAHRIYRMRIRSTVAKNALKISLPYAASELSVMLYMRLDVILVAYIIDQRTTGLYASAIGMLSAVFLVPAAIAIVMIPTLSRQLQTKASSAWRTALTMMLIFLLIGVIMTVALAFGAQFIDLLLGPSYTEVKSILRWLSPVVFLMSCTYGLSSILAAYNLQAKRSMLQFIAVGIDAGLNLWLLPQIGVRGAAYAYIASNLVLVLGYAWVIYRQAPWSIPADRF